MKYLILSLILAVGCASTPLPAERCTPALQSAYLSACQLAVEKACETDPMACYLPENSCQESLAELCPTER